MVSVTFSIPDEIKGAMKELHWISWSELAREELLKRIKIEQIRAQLNTPEEQEFIKWTVELGRKAKKGRWERVTSEINRR